MRSDRFNHSNSSSSPIRSLCVFCGASSGLEADYASAATGFGGLLAALDRRYRVKVKSRVREALGMTGATA